MQDRPGEPRDRGRAARFAPGSDRRRHIEIDGEVREKPLDVTGTEASGMATAVETDIPSNPVDVGLLGAEAVVLEADALADAREEPLTFESRGPIHVDRTYEICRGL